MMSYIFDQLLRSWTQTNQDGTDDAGTVRLVHSFVRSEIDQPSDLSKQVAEYNYCIDKQYFLFI